MRRLSRLVFLGFDALLVLLFLVGYAARYVHPQHTWGAELVAVGLPYLSMAVLGVFLGSVLARRWRLAGLHAVLVLLIAARFLPLGLVPRWEEAGAEALTVMTFNAENFDPGDDHKAYLLRRLARTQQADLIAFQETRVRYRVGRRASFVASPLNGLMDDSLQYRLARLIDPSWRRGQALNVTQPVLGRVQPLEQTYIPLRIDSSRAVDSYVARVRFRWKGREAVLYNLHLYSFGAEKPWEEDEEAPLHRAFWRRYRRHYREAFLLRAREVEQVRALMEKETLPLLVVGDFNSTPHSWVYRQMAEGMQDAYKKAGWGWGATYHRQFPFARIDFVLASPEWKIVSAEVPSVSVSDHRPLVVQLRWREEAR